MSAIVAFLLLHWELSLGFILVSAYWIVTEIALFGCGDAIASDRLVQLMNQEAVVIIDIRPAESFRQGHILQALSVTKDQLSQQLAQLKIAPEKTIVLVDEQGLSANKLIAKIPFVKKCYLKNGIQGWIQSTLPLHKE